MRLVCIYTLSKNDSGVFLHAVVEGKSEDLNVLADRLYDANAYSNCYITTSPFTSGILVSSEENGKACFRYSSVVHMSFIVKTTDVAQALNDLATHIQEFIE